MLKNNSIELLLEPLHRLLPGDTLTRSEPGGAPLPASNTVARPLQHNKEIHTEDTNMGVILQTEIDVFLNTETEVSSLGEVPGKELVLLDLLCVVCWLGRKGDVGIGKRDVGMFGEKKKRKKNEREKKKKRTLSPFSRISMAFFPRTVQWTAIFSLRRIPKPRIVKRAKEEKTISHAQKKKKKKALREHKKKKKAHSRQLHKKQKPKSTPTPHPIFFRRKKKKGSSRPITPNYIDLPPHTLPTEKTKQKRKKKKKSVHLDSTGFWPVSCWSTL